MKTDNPETVSRKWQMAHLEHHFGRVRATQLVGASKAMLVIGNKTQSQKPYANSKRDCRREVGFVGIGLTKA